MMLIPWRHNHGHDLLHAPDLFRREIDRLFGDFSGRGLAAREGFAPRLEVSETEEQVVVSAELPGMDEKDLDVTFSHGRLVISGEKKAEREEKDEEESYTLLERSYGSFSRAVDLGEGVDVGKASASYKNGILTVKIPKAEAARTRKIDVKGE